MNKLKKHFIIIPSLINMVIHTIGQMGYFESESGPIEHERGQREACRKDEEIFRYIRPIMNKSEQMR